MYNTFSRFPSVAPLLLLNELWMGEWLILRATLSMRQSTEHSLHPTALPVAPCCQVNSSRSACPMLLTPHLSLLPHTQAERWERSRYNRCCFTEEKTVSLCYWSLFSVLAWIITQDALSTVNSLRSFVTLAFVVTVHLLGLCDDIRSRLRRKCHHMAMRQMK